MIAAPEWNGERRLDLGIAADAAQAERNNAGIGVGPQHHCALAAQIAEIDPWRAPRIAIDQDARVLGLESWRCDVRAPPVVRPLGQEERAPEEQQARHDDEHGDHDQNSFHG